MNEKKAQTVGIFLIAGTIFLIVAIVIIRAVLINNSPQIKYADCHKEGAPYALTSILVDHTDSIGVISRVDLENKIMERVIARTQPGELVELYSVRSIGDTALTVEGEECSPGNLSYFSDATSNSRLVKKRWVKFENRIGKIMEDLLSVETANTSPIMEGIQSLSVTSFGKRGRSELPKRLVIVSDLLQNSTNWSVYQQGANFNDFSRMPGARRALTADLSGVEVFIFFIRRQVERSVSEKELRLFWKHWIESRGGKWGSVSRIEGVN